MITENDLPVSRLVYAVTKDKLEVSGGSSTQHAVLNSVQSEASDGSYTLDTSPYEGEVMVLATDNYGSVWQPDTAYEIGDVIRPAEFQGYVYHCTIAGTSDSIEPAWWFDTEQNQDVGTAQFKAKPYSRHWLTVPSFQKSSLKNKQRWLINRLNPKTLSSALSHTCPMLISVLPGNIISLPATTQGGELQAVSLG